MIGFFLSIGLYENKTHPCPVGKNYKATFNIDGKKGTRIISTREGSSNCITDIKVH